MPRQVSCYQWLVNESLEGISAYKSYTEIKIIAWSIIGRSTPCLKGNAYQITDPLNITSVPPKATIILQPLNRQLQG